MVPGEEGTPDCRKGRFLKRETNNSSFAERLYWIRAMTQCGPFSERVVEFWMCKAVDWGQPTSALAKADVKAHLPKLRAFLQLLLQELKFMRSTTEAMCSFPFLGQLVGRLCWNSTVSADGDSLDHLLQCLWWLYSCEPQNAVERRANQWIQNLLHHLSVEEGRCAARTSVRRAEPTTHARAPFLRNMVALLEREVQRNRCPGLHPAERFVSLSHGIFPQKSASPGVPPHRPDLLRSEWSSRGNTGGNTVCWCPCDDVRGASVTCTALVTCPEAAPLIGALLQHPAECDRAALSEDFLEAVNTALLGNRLALEEPTLLGLWSHSLPSLEGATLSLVEFALSDPPPSLQTLEQRVTDSLLPNASAHHHHMFLVVSNIFRMLLMETQGSPALRTLIQTFTRCLLLSLRLVPSQERLSLKVFCPHAPAGLLTPLLQIPSDVPPEAWSEHLLLISHFLQRGEEKEEDDSRGSCNLFESWFLLVQAGFWVDVAAQLLVMSGPKMTPPLLWLLTFYYHPIQLEEQSATTRAMAGEALDLVRMLFISPSSPSPSLTQVLRRLLSSCPLLLLHLLLNSAVFLDGPASTITEVLHQVAVQAGRSSEDERLEIGAAAVALLARVERALSCRAAQDPRAQARLRTVQQVLGL
ncbi:hypothetical protein GJAV_G00023490 [Gymnothorax javanicus]|nr:hypothetical protein GJAV_G00023490 [Gymnothorax javanicus]